MILQSSFWNNASTKSGIASTKPGIASTKPGKCNAVETPVRGWADGIERFGKRIKDWLMVSGLGFLICVLMTGCSGFFLGSAPAEVTWKQCHRGIPIVVGPTFLGN